MNKNKSLHRSLLQILTLAFMLTPVFAQAQDAIGRVIQTAGLVTAVNTAGAERQLARGSEIFAEETITTGPSGSAQLRLTDGAVISLEVDSFFTVDEYEYDGAGGAADTTIMTMARGTMRTLTGVIGDDPADTYQLNTPFASIGVRGTEYGVIVDNTGRVRVVVFDGAVSLAPVGGGAPVTVGVGGDTDAAEIADGANVVELDAIADPEVQAALRAVVEMVTAAISDQDVANLPSPAVALQVREANQQRQQEQQQQQQQENNPGGRDAAGVLTDAEGNVQVVRTNEDLATARVVVVVSVSRENPGAFDVTVTQGVTPNR